MLLCLDENTANVAALLPLSKQASTLAPCTASPKLYVYECTSIKCNDSFMDDSSGLIALLSLEDGLREISV